MFKEVKNIKKTIRNSLKRFRKGQSSIEFIAVVGLALVIAAPFIGSLESTVQDTRTTSDGVTVTNTLDELEAAVNTVGVEGPPSQRTFYVDFPDTIGEATIEEAQVIMLTLDRPEGESEIFRITNTRIDADETELPQEPGRHRLRVEAGENGVIITEAD